MPEERKVLYWYDPMVPDQRFDKPGKSPFMDMQLVPKYASDSDPGDAGEVGIAIDPGLRQNLGVRTVVVERGRLASTLRVPGTIGWDLRQEHVVSARLDAIVDRLHVKAPFEPVRAGQPLATILAPAWSSALAESRSLGRAQSASARELQAASQQRLRALGVPAGATGNGRITLTSPIAGVVSEIGARQGQAAPAGMTLFRINGTATVWLEAAIPQAAVSTVAAGTPVEAMVDARPGQLFRGHVETLLPQVDAGNRTQPARIVLENPDGALAPGMFAQVALTPREGDEWPLVPSDALIGGGAQARVIVLGEDDRFRPVQVKTGRSGNGMTEVIAGLQGGERIVASGQFLIDSEANLSGALQRMDSGAAALPAAAAEDGSHGAHDSRGSDDADADGRPAATKSETPALPPAPEPAPASDQRSAPPAARRCPVLYWYDPMVPEQRFEQPGKSPFMDMQLVPKFAADADPGCTIRDVSAAAAEQQP
ncbi:efflux RND transporter periplasmic adaptor subunit [Pseudoxanthomonas wuyuanensis]|nr:efflux RND transporter periplasmic adaptor subunit [Pseudoxanthomonas wuyuanensis]